MMDDLISRQAAVDASCTCHGGVHCNHYPCKDVQAVMDLPSAQPQYEELTPEEAASEIASGSIMSAQYWLDAMIRLKQMGYAICRKR